MLRGGDEGRGMWNHKEGAWGQDYDKPSPQDLYLRLCSTFVFNHMILCFESICHGLLFQLTNLEKNSAVVRETHL